MIIMIFACSEDGQYIMFEHSNLVVFIAAKYVNDVVDGKTLIYCINSLHQELDEFFGTIVTAGAGKVTREEMEKLMRLTYRGQSPMKK